MPKSWFEEKSLPASRILTSFAVSIKCPNLDLKKNLDCENFIGHSVNTTGLILTNSVFDPMKKCVPMINGPQGHPKVIVLNRPKRFHYFDDIILIKSTVWKYLEEKSKSCQNLFFNCFQLQALVRNLLFDMVFFNYDKHENSCMVIAHDFRNMWWQVVQVYISAWNIFTLEYYCQLGLTLMLQVANFANEKWWEKTWKMIETLANAYPSESTQWGLFSRYQYDRV